ncbi:MAG: phosphate ABC transporter substrate-binding protein PstS [Elusimicrobia bacterium]|nr:phosphate ABC transporter substrate-binding protein PstS [Elusimicrobiota bacterium]
MRNIFKAVVVVALAAHPAAAGVSTLNGAGATFPYPIYSKWFDDYNKVKPDLQINYQSIGSGGGIRQITARTVDFGATDAPMTDKQLFKVDGKLLHLPTVLGGVVPVYNLPGNGDLKFTGEILAGIFMGKIMRWNDPALQKENPDAKLPDMPITVVHRSDGSGTTYCFVDYLSKVSKEWDKKVGRAASVNWLTGLGAKGNEGVAGLVIQTPNSIGYVELVYAKQNNISYGAVKNASGKFVKAGVESIAAAAAGLKMPADFRVSITDSPNPGAYPISTYTWLLVYQKNPGEKGAVLREFLSWMLEEGQKRAAELGFSPLPADVKAMVAKAVQTVQ